MYIAKVAENRDTFNKNEEEYLDNFPMSKERREAVLKDWNLLLELGGNIYYTSKLAANDGINLESRWSDDEHGVDSIAR